MSEAPANKAGAIGVGIAGYGLAGRVFHGPLVSHTPGLEVRAVFSRTEARREEAASHYRGIKTHATYEALLDDPAVQLIVVGTPHDTHAPMVIQAAEAGKHVVVDKIMCLSVAEGRQMIEAARRNRVLFSVFHNRRWDSDYLTVKSVLEQGLVGEPYVIESAVTSFGATPGYRNPTSDRPRGWRTYAELGGGPMRDWGAHLFDQAVQLAGPLPDLVFADFQYRRDWDVETAGHAWLRYAPRAEQREGLRYVVETGAISAIPRPRWYIRGSEGAYVQHGRDAQEAALNRGEVGPRIMDPEHAPRLVRYADGQVRDVPVEQVPGNYLAYYENVAAALRGEAELAVKPENVLHSIRLIEAAAQSAESGSTVRPELVQI
ncbi:MAG TPA: Gfo/Idh/MocA family oxidoreductase [Chloroflexota bacterium]|nr:Gfo/Idh/MocA family oxidoreductase [Chloroflexota bacterium]